MYRYFKHTLRGFCTEKSSFINKSLPIIEEFFKTTLDIDAKVNIITEVPVVVNSCDILADPNGCVFHARLRSSPTIKEEKKKSTSWFKWLIKDAAEVEDTLSPCMQVILSDDQKTVDVILHKKNCASNAYCEIEMPIFADLKIDAYDKVRVNSLHSQDLMIMSSGDISTQNVRCQRDINICSTNGSIICQKKLMGKTIQLSTTKKHPIELDVVTGGKLHVLTEDGNISSNSIYAVNSRFESKNGKLKLKNVHEHSDIIMHGKGVVQMEGTRAEINICAADSILDLQLAYVAGISNINCNEAAAYIGISDKVEKMVDLDICSATLKLDNSLKSLEKYVSEDKTKLQHKIGQNNPDKLTIRGKCTISLFQELWIKKLLKNATI